MTLPAPAIGSAPAAAMVLGLDRVQALCFVHVGPEDKPMPAFCLPAPGLPSSASDSAAEWLVITPQAWQELAVALQGASPPDPGQPAVFGQYRVLSKPPVLDRLVTPQFMRQLLLIMQRDARRAGLAQPALIDRLSRRLAGGRAG